MGRVWAGWSCNSELANVLDQTGRVTDVGNQCRVYKGSATRNEQQRRLTARLEKLHDCPQRDMLEGGVGAGQEAIQVLVHAPFWFLPNVVECRVVIRSRTAI